jgi:ribose-phosphate pyrophosphokinase
MKITKYPDGTSYVDVDTEPSAQFTFRINTYEDLWHLNQIVDAFNTKGITPTVTIPNLIDAQADRRFSPHQSSGLKLVGEFLNKMNARFQIFHPHNSEVVEALIDDVKVIDNSTFINQVIEQLVVDKFGEGWDSFQKTSYLTNMILMSSDAGGFKPLMKLADKVNWMGETFSASKARSWDKEEGTKFVQQIDRDDFKGKDILIVDDISVYGGTFKGLAKLLREKNVGKLYLAVSHMTVKELGNDPVSDYFDKVFTTNSKFDKYYRGNKNNSHYSPTNLEIINLFKL